MTSTVASELRKAVEAVDRTWRIEKNAYDMERFDANHNDLVDRLREMRRALVRAEVDDLTIRERLTPSWPGGGFFCVVCPHNQIGHVKPEAWAQFRHMIEHVEGCALKEN